MMKLFKHLKPFTLPLLVAIALLYGQAMAELALPDYMSNIVNVGIQQGGVNEAIPVVLKQSDAAHLKLFLNPADKKIVFDHYELINTSDMRFKDYTAIYKKLGTDPIYILKEVDSETKNQLEVVISKGLLSVSGVQTLMDDANGGPIQLGEKKLPAGTDLFALLEKMPEMNRQETLKGTTEKFAGMDDKMIVQAGANALKAYYEQIGADMGLIQRNYILYMGGVMLLITLLGAIAAIAVGYISAKIAAGLGRDLRKKVFDKVSKFTNVELDQFSTSSLITRSTNDINQIQNLTVMMIRMAFYAPIMGVGGVIKAMEKSSHMSWIIAVAVGIMIVLITVIFSIAMPKFKMIQKLIDRLNLVTRENLSGMMVIRAFNTQAFEENRFDKANKDVMETNLFVNRIMTFMMPMMMLIMNGTTLAIVWIGAHQIAESNMQVGDMMAFMQYAIQIIFSFLMLSMMFIMIPRAAVSAQRIAEVLDTEISILDPENPQLLPEGAKGEIEFKNVSFKYPAAEEEVIKEISFVAKPGETTAIIGSTGSGKTTLVNLIPRLYDVTGGQILMDGVDIRELKQFDLRAEVGYVPQRASLFSGTIQSNFQFADDEVTLDEMKEAARIAQAMSFIDEKPEGFEREIAQGGGNVSGGQKQRLSIARALVKKPKVFIFDDSFSALDFKTDSELRKALKESTGNSTLLIVAQRISTIKNAEQIIVLDDGKVVGKGTHGELMSTCETYREIALSQLSKEELA